MIYQEMLVNLLKGARVQSVNWTSYWLSYYETPLGAFVIDANGKCLGKWNFKFVKDHGLEKMKWRVLDEKPEQTLA